MMQLLEYLWISPGLGIHTIDVRIGNKNNRGYAGFASKSQTTFNNNISHGSNFDPKKYTSLPDDSSKSVDDLIEPDHQSGLLYPRHLDEREFFILGEKSSVRDIRFSLFSPMETREKKLDSSSFAVAGERR